MSPEMEKWIESRPPKVREAFRKWPFGTRLTTKQGVLWVIGFSETESPELVVAICSEIDPEKDFYKATAKQNRRYICVDHLPNPSALQ
jgi:hypothetical protein